MFKPFGFFPIVPPRRSFSSRPAPAPSAGAPAAPPPWRSPPPIRRQISVEERGRATTTSTGSRRGVHRTPSPIGLGGGGRAPWPNRNSWPAPAPVAGDSSIQESATPSSAGAPASFWVPAFGTRKMTPRTSKKRRRWKTTSTRTRKRSRPPSGRRRMKTSHRIPPPVYRRRPFAAPSGSDASLLSCFDSERDPAKKKTNH